MLVATRFQTCDTARRPRSLLATRDTTIAVRIANRRSRLRSMKTTTILKRSGNMGRTYPAWPLRHTAVSLALTVDEKRPGAGDGPS
jgi:hypothetical protein